MHRNDGAKSSREQRSLADTVGARYRDGPADLSGAGDTLCNPALSAAFVPPVPAPCCCRGCDSCSAASVRESGRQPCAIKPGSEGLPTRWLLLLRPFPV